MVLLAALLLAVAVAAAAHQGTGPSVPEQLRALAELHQAGSLTPAEFSATKAAVLVPQASAAVPPAAGRPVFSVLAFGARGDNTTDDTLAIFHTLRSRHDNVGIVLQSRLFRTPDDVAALPEECDVRMVKGIYLEPAEIAHTTPDPIRQAFIDLTDTLLRAGHTVAAATHDAAMADAVLERQRAAGVPDERTYFEVLLGVQEPLWERWRQRGKTVRAYVPYGPEWRAYSQRRLRKNPEILRHLIKATLRLS